MNIEVDVNPIGGGTIKLGEDFPCSYPEVFEIEFTDTIMIEALAEEGFHFTHWSGEPMGEDNPVEIRAIRAMTITANFASDVVKSPASFALDSLTVNPSEVNIGETVLITALVTNTGELEGSYTMTLKIDDLIEQVKEINLAGGVSETVTFAVSEAEAGIHLIALDTLHGSFSVKEPPPSAISTEKTAPMIQSKWWLTVIILAAVVLAIVIPLALRKLRHSRRDSS